MKIKSRLFIFALVPGLQQHPFMIYKKCYVQMGSGMHDLVGQRPFQFFSVALVLDLFGAPFSPQKCPHLDNKSHRHFVYRVKFLDRLW